VHFLCLTCVCWCELRALCACLNWLQGSARKDMSYRNFQDTVGELKEQLVADPLSAALTTNILPWFGQHKITPDTGSSFRNVFYPSCQFRKVLEAVSVQYGIDLCDLLLLAHDDLMAKCMSTGCRGDAKAGFYCAQHSGTRENAAREMKRRADVSFASCLHGLCACMVHSAKT
jgi:hypothetical protein